MMHCYRSLVNGIFDKQSSDNKITPFIDNKMFENFEHFQFEPEIQDML